MSRGRERPSPEELFRRLSERGFDAERYELGDEIGAGGMGEVVLAHDDVLDRTVALKLSRRAGSAVDRHCGRFLDEARITSQLDHPGIVPVHELGVREDGKPFYTMKLVRGRTFDELLRDPQRWPLPRLVDVLLKVSEAMAYAHSKGVIHRDLKPANIMVGRYGEVYVMDWGLARVLSRDLADHVADAALQTVEVEASLRTPDSNLATGEGTALGTPAYMSPEQARGDLAELGPATDVYSVGAMLYRLLAGDAPYLAQGAVDNGGMLVRRVISGPPTSLGTLVPDADEELIAICERAMAREVSARFPGMDALVAQLRAWLEGRVVSAHRTGPWVEIVKWCRRNRTAAALSASLLVVLATSGFVLADSEHGRRREAEARAALEQRELALLRAEELTRRAEGLWPADPGAPAAMERWMTQARELLASVGTVEAELSVLRQRGTERARWPPPDPVARHIERRHIERMREILAEYGARLAAGEPDERLAAVMRRSVEVLEPHLPQREAHLARADAAVARARPWGFRLPADQQLHDTLRRIDDAAWELASPGGLLDRMAQRREQALQLAGVGGALSPAWRAALASVPDPAQCPAYGGRVLAPQAGLEPLRRNPATGLWEFLHTLTGEAPELDAEGRWIVGSETGVVLVLVPGGRSWLGAQRDLSGAPAHDPYALQQDGPPRVIELDWFFLAAHELTQAQWARLCGDWPARHFVGEWGDNGPYVSLPLPSSVPVESVSWVEAVDVLGRIGLVLPTEAQWSHAARGGGESPFPWCRAEELSRLDLDTLRAVVLPRLNSSIEVWALEQGVQDASFTDGHLSVAPAGSFPPNAFGIFDLGGNVGEWCLDEYADDLGPDAVLAEAPGSGLLTAIEPTLRSWRGGSYQFDPLQEARVSARHGLPPEQRVEWLGVRAARAVDP